MSRIKKLGKLVFKVLLASVIVATLPFIFEALSGELSEQATDTGENLLGGWRREGVVGFHECVKYLTRGCALYVDTFRMGACQAR